jgi:hypothetical protein
MTSPLLRLLDRSTGKMERDLEAAQENGLEQQMRANGLQQIRGG